jgi:hypothetical protein
MIGNSPFTLVSGYFTAAWRNGLTIEALGYSNGQIVDTATFTVNTSGPTYEYLNFQNVDAVTFVSFGGTLAGFDLSSAHGPLYTQFAMDNLTVESGNGVATQLVPEPSSLVLVGLAVACVGGYAWRRRRRAVVGGS